MARNVNSELVRLGQRVSAVAEAFGCGIGECKTKPGPPGRPPSVSLAGKPTANRLHTVWECGADNGAAISGHTLQIWLASSLSSYPKQLIGMLRLHREPLPHQFLHIQIRTHTCMQASGLKLKFYRTTLA